jgi:hypothetical protein
MAVDMDQGVRASRLRVPRSRGAFSGIALVVLGAWAALVPFIGPYFDFAFSPAPTDAWHWTADRGWLEVLPGVVAVVAGLILLFGTNRLSLTFAGWLGAASGAWLIVGPILAPRFSLITGAPASTTPWVQTLEKLFFFFALGAGILFFASSALGRVSVHGVREVRAAQRRAEAETARQEEERRLAEQRFAEERSQRERDEAQGREQRVGDSGDQQVTQQRQEAATVGRGDNGVGSPTGASTDTGADTGADTTARHERPADQPPNFSTPTSGSGYPPPAGGASETREYPAQRSY